MSNENKKQELIAGDTNRQKAVDLAAAGLKGVISGVPVVGPVLAEVLGVYIPNRRLERVVTMLEMFADQVKDIEQDIRDTRMQTEEFATLLEEGVYQAARSLTDDRRAYIASFLANSLSDDELSILQQRKMLDILGELNDAEIIILAYHNMEIGIGDENDFLQKHEHIIFSEPVSLDSSDEEFDQEALRSTFEATLTRFGLIKQEARFTSTTRLGQIILRYINAPTE